MKTKENRIIRHAITLISIVISTIGIHSQTRHSTTSETPTTLAAINADNTFASNPFKLEGLESDWTNFETTLYADSNNYFEVDGNEITVLFSLSSEEITPSEIISLGNNINAWQLVTSSSTNNKANLSFKTTKELYKQNKTYLLKVFNCQDAIINGNQVSIEKIKKSINKKK